jgi:hypothetical protein
MKVGIYIRTPDGAASVADVKGFDSESSQTQERLRNHLAGA